MEIRPFQIADEAEVIALWQACELTRPWNDPHKDILRKQAVRPEWFLVATIDGKIVGTVMAGYEGHRGWINYLAVSANHRRHGIGQALMLCAEKLLADANCPKINLQVRTANKEAIEFYRAIGFAADDVVSMGKRLQQD
jgi:ribosomal protein S18 acetylase RimI-like enzyme